MIAAHLDGITGGKSDAQLTGEYELDPTNTKLAAEIQTAFQGTTLRGLLFEAHSYWKMGQIAQYGAIASFILAAVMGALTVLDFLHLRRETVSKEATEDV
ncbi:MAG TPA: hypothetical protein VFC03_11785 [Acidimicrobiales bacterium]|nr:hypothetical protein [Acidimicrobiales bacterium]